MLIDGHNLVFRAFHAIRDPMISPAGEHLNAVYGFTTMLLGLLDRERPTHTVVTFDSGPTFRNQAFPAYKASRAAPPQELRSQFRRIQQLLRTFGIASYSEKGYEADDVIGILACQAAEMGLAVTVVTSDKDLLQLAENPKIEILMPTPGASFSAAPARYDAAQVKARFGFDPRFIPDYKALVGDPSDELPGVPGVGDQTASALIQRYGTLEEILHNCRLLLPRAMKVNSKQHEALLSGATQAILVKKMATIRTRHETDDMKLDMRATRTGAGFDYGFSLTDAKTLFAELKFVSLFRKLEKYAELVGQIEGHRMLETSHPLALAAMPSRVG